MHIPATTLAREKETERERLMERKNVCLCACVSRRYTAHDIIIPILVITDSFLAFYSFTHHPHDRDPDDVCTHLFSCRHWMPVVLPSKTVIVCPSSIGQLGRQENVCGREVEASRLLTFGAIVDRALTGRSFAVDASLSVVTRRFSAGVSMTSPFTGHNSSSSL